MKVTVIPTIRDYPWGAPGHCMGGLVEELLEAKHEVQWFVAPIDLEHPEVMRLSRMGAIVVPLPAAPRAYFRFASLRRSLDRFRGTCPSLRKIIREFNPDHIFLNQGGTWCGILDEFYGVLEERPGRFSLICHLNKPETPMSAALLARARWLADHAARMFFNSRWTHNLAENQITHDISQALYFQYPLRFNCVEPLAWPCASIAKLAMVSRLDVLHKGMDLALQAIAQLKQSNLPVEITIVGRGSDESYLRNLIAWLHIEDNVQFFPYTENLSELWAGQEMLLLPSRYEGLAVSMVEAMNFGRIVLRTPYGGCEEWIEDGVNGYVCAAAEVNLLTETLKRALSERKYWREMGLAAHDKIKRNLDPRPGRIFLEVLNDNRASDSILCLPDEK